MIACLHAPSYRHKGFFYFMLLYTNYYPIQCTVVSKESLSKPCLLHSSSCDKPYPKEDREEQSFSKTTQDLESSSHHLESLTWETFHLLPIKYHWEWYISAAKCTPSQSMWHTHSNITFVALREGTYTATLYRNMLMLYHNLYIFHK